MNSVTQEYSDFLVSDILFLPTMLGVRNPGVTQLALFPLEKCQH